VDFNKTAARLFLCGALTSQLRFFSRSFSGLQRTITFTASDIAGS